VSAVDGVICLAGAVDQTVCTYLVGRASTTGETINLVDRTIRKDIMLRTGGKPYAAGCKRQPVRGRSAIDCTAVQYVGGSQR